MTEKRLYQAPNLTQEPAVPVSKKPYNVLEQLEGFDKSVNDQKGKQGKHQQAPAQTVSAGLTPYDA